MNSLTTTTRRLHLPLTTILHHLTTTTTTTIISNPTQRPRWTPPLPLPSSSSSLPQNPNPQFTTLSKLLKDPNISPGPPLESALNRSGIKPDESTLLLLFDHFDSSPNTLFTLFNWAQAQPGFRSSVSLLNAVVNALCKGRQFDSAWDLVHQRIRDKDNGDQPLPDSHTFAIIIRRYARADMPSLSIETYEFASRLEYIYEADLEQNMFFLLLDSLCKERHMTVAVDYVNKLKDQGRTFVSSTRTYNILLNGWCRYPSLPKVECLWREMKKEKVKLTVVTYGTLVEGLCRMCRVDSAMDLINEMKSEGIEPNLIVYNPIIDALGEAGRIKEALGYMERVSLLKSGPTASTFNSLVKGFCKAGNVEGAGKILKEMISRGCIPTSTTYNYFFKYFSRTGKVQECLNLYTKLMDSGYVPDRLTYHLLVKMLCEQEKLDLAIHITKEMRDRGYDIDLETCTMLILLMCKLSRFDQAIEGFEYMIQRGVVPQDVTFQTLARELRKRGLTEKLKQLHGLMASVPSTKQPDTYIRKGDRTRESSILQKAQNESNFRKTYNNPRQPLRRRYSTKIVIPSANPAVQDCFF